MTGYSPLQRMGYWHEVLEECCRVQAETFRRGIAESSRRRTMSEQEWLQSEDPQDLFAYIAHKMDARKLRLFVAACIDYRWLGAKNNMYKEEIKNEPREHIFGTAERWACRREEAHPDSTLGKAEPKFDGLRADILRDLTGNPFRRVMMQSNARIQRMAQSIYENEDWEGLPILGDLLEEEGNPEDILMHCRGYRRAQIDDGLRGFNTWVPCKIHARGCWVLDLILGKE